MKKILLLLILIALTQSVFSKILYPKTETVYKAHELTITDSKVARKIFTSLPAHSYSASMVNELLIKNHKYFYCVREPDGQFLCHLYLNFKYNGEFANFEKDHEYGIGSLVEYTSKEVIKGNSNIEISNDYLTMSFEGELARKIYTKLDLSHVTYKRIDGTDIELRSGRHIRCANIDTPNSEIRQSHVCKVQIPIRPNRMPDKEIEMIQLGLN